ncbi:MAG: glycosyltransferase family 39 protein, partial [Candidatus Paraprevotella stercoravium]|nr:glycosyltransferase family 39 protein [Candidatus Paraprevotella stercoravium]
MKMYRQDKYVWILTAVCIVSLFLFLGEALFNTRGEPREAVVALSMLEKGNWILPVNNGVDMAYKPPLFHWCIALASTVVGQVTEYTSRMPSALALTVMVLAGYAFYAKRRGREVAFIMALL